MFCRCSRNQLTRAYPVDLADDFRGAVRSALCVKRNDSERKRDWRVQIPRTIVLQGRHHPVLHVFNEKFFFCHFDGAVTFER
jgi:hypothetical protein